MATENELDNKSGVSFRQISLLFLAVFLDLFGFGIIVPILPDLAYQKLGASGFEYGLIIALYSLMQFIFSPIWGTISDRIGRRPVIIMGLGGSVIGFSIFGFANSLWMIYLSRSIAGIFTAATLTTANAYIADITTPNERGKYFGLIAAAFGLGFALGPAVGGFLAIPIFGFDEHALPSFSAALMALINMILAFAVLPESLSEKLKEKIKSRKQRKLAILDTFKYRNYPGVLLFVSIFALASFGFSDFIAAFPIYAQEVDSIVDTVDLAIYFTYIGFLLFFTQMVLIRPLLKYFAEENVVKIGILLYIAGFVMLPFAPSFYPWMFLTNTPLILGIGLLNPSLNSLISIRTPQEEQGKVLGINQGWASFTRIFGPIVGGALFDINIVYPFYFATLIFVIIGIITFGKVRKRPPSEFS